VQLPKSEDILGQQIVLDEAPVFGLIPTDNRVIAVVQHLWPLGRFPVAHIQRALFGDYRLGYSQGNHTIGMLCDKVIAKEMRHASLSMGSLLCWHAVVPIGLWALGKPLDPRTFLQVLPGWARDTTECLTAHTVHTTSTVHGSSKPQCLPCIRSSPRTCGIARAIELLVTVQVYQDEVAVYICPTLSTWFPMMDMQFFVVIE
jgi:hypothetical protein